MIFLFEQKPNRTWSSGMHPSLGIRWSTEFSSSSPLIVIRGSVLGPKQASRWAELMSQNILHIFITLVIFVYWVFITPPLRVAVCTWSLKKESYLKKIDVRHFDCTIVVGCGKVTSAVGDCWNTKLPSQVGTQSLCNRKITKLYLFQAGFPQQKLCKW